MLKNLPRTLSLKISLWGWLVILTGSISWSLTMVKSGLCWTRGCASAIGFWGPNGHDGIWHIALIKSLAKGSWEIPILAGETLTNYHFGFDILVAFIHKLTLVSVERLYFQILPPLTALLIGIFVYKFVFQWKKSYSSAFWACFFVYFGGSFGWIITLFREKSLGGESIFWSQQSISTLVNPPFATSQVFIFAGLYLLSKVLERKNKNKLPLISFLFGVLILIKVYAGLLLLGGLLVAGFYQLVKERRILLIKVFSGALVVSLLLFLPTAPAATSSVIFRPFWFLETMMSLPDRVGWQRFGEAMVNYRLGNIWYKTIPAYFLAFLIFWYGNMGMRVLGEVYIAKRILKKKVEYFDVIFLSIIIVGVIIPMFFLQVGTPWNTIQFFYYSLIFSGVLSGIVFGEWIDKANVFNNSVYDAAIHHTKVMVLMLVVAGLTLPTTYSTLRINYLPSRPPSELSGQELKALQFLSRQPDGVILTYPFNKAAAEAAIDHPPRPLYLYESTAYVSAFSEKPVYLEDEVNLNITGYDWLGRRKKVENFLRTKDQKEARLFLRENNLDYIYWVGKQRAKLDEEQLAIEKIFENDEVSIYKVKRQ